MPAQTLRPYQADAVNRVVEAYRRGARRILMVLPTGAGKTTIFTSITDRVVAKEHRRALILCHRRELVTQAANRLNEFGVDYGLIMAHATPKPYARVQIATVQTLARRKLPSANIVVCDEAHLSTAETWRQILDAYPNALVLGVTATPWRLGGKPLADAYDEVIVVTKPSELRQQGYLCEYQGFGYLAPDLSGVKTTGGDYNEQQSAAAMRAPGIVANIVEKWRAHASHLSTVVFAVTVEHSKQLCAEFVAAGVRAEHLDGSTPLEQRNAIMKRMNDGATQVLCNVGVAVEGLDIPRLKCCVLARPTKSLARAIQMMGRVRRPWNDQSARIHDHAFVIAQHGLPDADGRDYSVHAEESLGSKKEGDELSPVTACSKCFALFEGATCPSCSTPRPVVEHEIRTVEGAEEFGFDSGSTAPVQIPRIPTRVQWKAIGRVIEGVFERMSVERTHWGQQNRYVVRSKDRRYDFPGTTQLDRLMAKVKPNDKITVTFTGERPIGDGRHLKEFRVEKEEPEDPRVKEAAERAQRAEKRKIRNTQIVELSTNGLSGPEIAHQLGCTESIVFNVRKSSGLCSVEEVKPGVGPSDRVRSQALDLVRSGASFRSAAKSIGVSPNAVKNWAITAGIYTVDKTKVPKGIPEELKTATVNRVLNGESFYSLAAELGVDESTIRGWVKRRVEQAEASP